MVFSIGGLLLDKDHFNVLDHYFPDPSIPYTSTPEFLASAPSFIFDKTYIPIEHETHEDTLLPDCWGMHRIQEAEHGDVDSLNTFFDEKSNKYFSYCIQSLAFILGIFLPSLMIVLDMLYCPVYKPSWTVCLIFTIWSLGLRLLLVTLLPPYVQTEGVNLWDRSSKYSSLSKASLIRLLFFTLLNRMDVLRALIEPYWKRQKPCTNMPTYLKCSVKTL